MIHYDFRATGLVVFDKLEAYRERRRSFRGCAMCVRSRRWSRGWRRQCLPRLDMGC